MESSKQPVARLAVAQPRPAAWRLAVVAATVVFCTFWLLVPSPEERAPLLRIVREFEPLGYAIHVATYAVLSGAVLQLARRHGRLAGWAVGGILLHGVGTELVQVVVPSRTPDVFDLLANLLGIACGMLLCRAWRTR